MLPLDDHAWHTAQHHLDSAALIDAAARAVDISHAHAHACYRRRELAELRGKLLRDPCRLVIIERNTPRSDVGLSIGSSPDDVRSLPSSFAKASRG